MKISDVPQDRGMIDQENTAEVCYAVDPEGRYVLAPSIGWEPKNIVNDQAWGVIHRDVADAISKIKSGKLSPLAYHMAKNQMSPGLLAKYARCTRLSVRRHLKPSGFSALSVDMLKRYADIFEITIEALGTVPKDVSPPNGARTPDTSAP